MGEKEDERERLGSGGRQEKLQSGCNRRIRKKEKE